MKKKTDYQPAFLQVCYQLAKEISVCKSIHVLELSIKPSIKSLRRVYRSSIDRDVYKLKLSELNAAVMNAEIKIMGSKGIGN